MLSDSSIRKALEDKELTILGPHTEGDIQPCSVDLTLGSRLKIIEPSSGGVVDPYDPSTVTEQDVDIRGKAFALRPGVFVLGHTEQLVSLSSNIAGTVGGKSSLARLGLTVHVTAGHIDPGFSGQITLEMHSTIPLLLRAGMPIAQLILTKVTGAVEVPYGVKRQSRYNHQIGPTSSRFTARRSLPIR